MIIQSIHYLRVGLNNPTSPYDAGIRPLNKIYLEQCLQQNEEPSIGLSRPWAGTDVLKYFYCEARLSRRGQQQEEIR